MNEEYGLSSDRMEQQLMIKTIVHNINPDFSILFNEFQVQVTANNSNNKSLDGKHHKKLDIHKVSECIEQLIEVEKQVIEAGIMPNQFSDFVIDNSYFRISFWIKQSLI